MLDVSGGLMSRGMMLVVVIVVVLAAAIIMAQLRDPRAVRGVMSTVGGKGSTGAGISLLPWH